MTHRPLLRRAPAVALAGLAALGLVLALPDAAWAQGVALESAGRGTEIGLWAARFANHVALALVVGLLLVPAWLLGGAGIGPTGRRASRAAAMAAVAWAVSAGLILVFGLSNAAARPLPQALDGALLSRFAGTRFGSAVLAQAAAALVVALLAWVARNRSGTRLALAVAALGALGPAWWGHAGTAELRLVALASTWLHVVGAAVWVGGLVAVVVVVLRGRAPAGAAGPTARFSTLAGWALLAVAATGVVNVLLHTTAPAQLVETSWGRAALAKALLLVGLAALGWAHRRRTVPRLRSAGAGSAARRLFIRMAGVELLVMLAAFGLATTMASGLPANVEAASRIQMFVAPLGEGFAEVSLDPARTGRNELHIYVYDADRRLRPVDSAGVRLSSDGEEVVPRLVPSGPGHFTGPAVELPGPGTWRVRVEVEVDGRVEEAIGAVDVR